MGTTPRTPQGFSRAVQQPHTAGGINKPNFSWIAKITKVGITKNL
jgi:hypothetical protein